MRRCGRVASAAEFAPSFPRRLAWQSARALAEVKPKLVRAARPRGRASRRPPRRRNRTLTAARAVHKASWIGAAHIAEGAAHIAQRAAHTLARIAAAQIEEEAAHIADQAAHIAAARTARRHIAARTAKARMANWSIAPAAMAGS